MTTARLPLLRWRTHRLWVEPVAVGLALGLALAGVGRLGLWPTLERLPDALHRSVGPVWIPMALAGLRVGWLALRALRTRAGRGRLGEPVRPELGQIAPVFAALGLCGTVWGLSRAFEALEGGDFLTQLPLLLGGLGAAMTSTLVGLGLQIATLGIGLVNPAWSWLEVRLDAGALRFCLDGRAIGDGDEGFRAAVSGLRARAPEALCLAIDRRAPGRAELAARLWRELDAAVRVREVRL
jgi:hypothetical protein